MTKSNEVTAVLESIFSKVGAPYVCELVGSPHDPNFNAIAIYSRTEMPDRGVIMQSDLTDVQYAHLSRSFARIGVASYRVESLEDLEAVYASKLPIATFTTSDRFELLVASKDGVETLSADNSNPAVCIGLLNVNAQFFKDNSFNLITAMKRLAPKASLRAKPKGP